ncbi:MAG: SpoIIE family protein phosphatase [bacterium]|nr:SpoIIE family protein phosphatase [bacterium]
MSERTEGRILLVDNERLARFAISALLKTSRFEVTAVESPEKGLAELQAHPYDLVLSDVIMGTMDGFAFREAVRGFNARIPIVFLTALVHSPTNQLQERIAADAHSCYVPKNARRDVLLTRIRQAVSGYRAEREAAELKAALRADLEVAAHVQSALLPPPVALGPKLFYSALSCPHDIVTGDFCHWKKLTDEAGVLVFGDISGHGTSAALAMAAVVAHLKGLADSEGVRQHRPHLVCRDLDRFIRQNLRDVCYLSGTVLFADFGAKKIRYLNAGGPEPLCFARSDASRIELNPGRRGGLPMGLMDGATYDEADVVEASFPSDALFCLYSDGYGDLSTDAAGEERLPPEMLSDIIAELVRGASGTLDLTSLPYRLNALLRDMGYVHAHDDRHFLVAGRSMAGGVRFLRVVPMDDPAEIDRAVEDAARWAAARKYPEAAVARLELLLGEHLANVRGHALTEARRRSEVVALEIRPAAGDLEVCAWDRGTRWEGDLSEVVPHPDLALDAQNAAFAARGRGFAILRKVARSIAYERFEGLNKYTFLLQAKAGGGDDMLAPRAHGRAALVATGNGADAALPSMDDAAATSAALPNVPLSRPPPLFQRDCWDRQLRTGESYAQKWEYVRNNPVRKGLVAHADEWPYQGQVNVLEWHERT